MSGFITIERRLWKHDLFVASPMSEREAFMWMIARACWADTQHRVGSEMVAVERGSFMATLREMQDAFMWASDKKVRNYLKKLENHGMLAVQTMGQRNARKTHVTICNYNEYQTAGRSKDAAKTHDGRTTDAVKKPYNQTTNIDTSVSIGEPPPKKPVKRACAIPENWVPNQKNIDHALSKNFTEQEIENEAANFRNHHLARGTTFKDWDAGWRTWISNAIKFGNAGRGGGSRQSGRGAGTLDAFAQVAVNRYGNES